MDSLRRPLWGIYALIIIVAIGIGGYMVIEGWSFLDALYMTVTTITTVGYKEVHPLDVGGQIFTLFLIIGGVVMVGIGFGFFFLQNFGLVVAIRKNRTE